jgi:hypothetical protein
LGSIKGEEFHEKLNEYWLSKGILWYGTNCLVAYRIHVVSQSYRACCVACCLPLPTSYSILSCIVLRQWTLWPVSPSSCNDTEGQYCSGPLKEGSADAKLAFIWHIIV